MLAGAGWPGVAIANRVVAEAGAVPWRMAAADYLESLEPGRVQLTGAPVEPSWDGELGAATTASPYTRRPCSPRCSAAWRPTRPVNSG